MSIRILPPWRTELVTGRSSKSAQGGTGRRITSTLAACLFFWVFIAERAPIAAQAPQGEPVVESASNKVVIVLVDHSESMKNLADRNQALVTHLIRLAALSNSQVRMAVVFFGGESEVTVVADDQGKPTAAYESLLDKIARRWPRPDGQTPMEQAFAKVLSMIKDLAEADVTVLLLTDGEPCSGILRDDLIEVKAFVDKELAAAAAEVKDFPPEAIQRRVVQRKRELLDGETARGKQLLRIQMDAEFKKTKQHAEAMGKLRARFVTVDYVGLEPLQELHRAAGGKPEDFLLVRPAATVLEKIDARGLTTMPRVLSVPPLVLPSDAAVFEKTITLKVDPLADRCLASISFDRGIDDWDKHAVLEARVGNRTYTFTPANDDANAVLSLDGQGKVVAAHLALDGLQPEAPIQFTYRSPTGTASFPGAKVYLHLRLSDDAVAEFRAGHFKADQSPPFKVSSTQTTKWTAALRSRTTGKPFALQRLEALLRNRATGNSLRLICGADPSSPNVFQTEPKAIPVGRYDVELHIALGSGGNCVLVLPEHIVSENVAEYLTLDVLQPGAGNTTRASGRRSHADAGELGDERNTAQVEMTVRSAGMAYPVEIRATVDILTDSGGNLLAGKWVSVQPDRFILQPGQPQKLLLNVRLPMPVDPKVLDGMIDGRLNFTRSDRNEVLGVKRFMPLVGVEESEAVERVSFTLRRPRLIPSSSRCLHEAILEQGEGVRLLPLKVMVHQPFQRAVVVEVRHDSKISRNVTLRSGMGFEDQRGRQLPTARLVPDPSTPTTQDIAPGGVGRWLLTFQIDDDDDVRQALSELEISSPGLAPVMVKVELQVRRPPLGPWLRIGLLAAGILLLLYAIVIGARWVRRRAFRAGNTFVLRDQQVLLGIVQLVADSVGRLNLLTLQPVVTGLPHDEQGRPLAAERKITLDPEQLRRDGGLEIRQPTESGQMGWRLQIDDVFPETGEVIGQILDAPAEMREARRQRLRLRLLGFLGCASLLIAWKLYEPNVLRAAQWCCEWVDHVL